MKKFSIKLIETVEYTKILEVEVPDTWTEQTIRDDLSPTSLDMYQEMLPEGVKVIDASDEWDSDSDILGRGNLVLGEIEES